MLYLKAIIAVKVMEINRGYNLFALMKYNL